MTNFQLVEREAEGQNTCHILSLIIFMIYDVQRYRKSGNALERSFTNLFPIYCVEIASSSKIRELGTKSVAANDATFFSVRRGIVFSK